jgi:hypothetical protein
VFFIESLCNDDTIVKANIEEVKIMSPDYKTYQPEDAAGMYHLIFFITSRILFTLVAVGNAI